MTASVGYSLGRSIRSYRKFLDELLKQAWRGERPFDDVAKAAAGIKPAVEMFLAEKQLAALGGDVQAPFEPAGDNVAEELGPHKKHKTLRITARTGLDKHGAVVDDKTVIVEGAVEDEAELEAEALGRTLV